MRASAGAEHGLLRTPIPFRKSLPRSRKEAPAGAPPGRMKYFIFETKLQLLLLFLPP